MSIARVRIAPVEQWCKGTLASVLESGIVGMEIEIMTESMRTALCGGRKWKITPKSNQQLNLAVGFEDPCEWMCEHYFEMD